MLRNSTEEDEIRWNRDIYIEVEEEINVLDPKDHSGGWIAKSVTVTIKARHERAS